MTGRRFYFVKRRVLRRVLASQARFAPARDDDLSCAPAARLPPFKIAQKHY
jgi:hypothetical protein